ncbi:UvrD-helicase domain-containing protein [Gracilimonas sediminicola]|uniref:DNA 3'-5' helicase n=1 Tax=Gracilimonas sediminicola TaxID=2952158 RepID=A0A9X2L1G0_9BACT|nr:UvrD-helicase domain-containing protein [Gracilimonas sediminicola]MCP9290571.1 AAA family ATPase [Gracilimonas sediminicola]
MMSKLNITELTELDTELLGYLSIDKPESFFLFAGAGSGKTRSLVSVLNALKHRYKKKLVLKGQRIGVITYTNGARDEILSRLEYDNLFSVSTIHSFAWSLIQSYQNDIREWLRIDTELRIEELEELISKGREGTKTHADRIKKIESKRVRLENLNSIKKFSYNPNGDNFSRDSVNHTEVIKMCSDFLSDNEMMKEILTQKFPILLIDESQDTNKDLIEALFKVQSEKSKKFSLGLFGDMMQRIYMDGKKDLGKQLPQDWKRPSKKINYRSPKRVIELINKIRSYDDDHIQEAIEEANDGIVRLFVVSGDVDKQEIEKKVMEDMASITEDVLWSGNDAKVKALILEHHMAASRMGFSDFFDPLYASDRLKTGILDGTLPELRFFSDIILPIVKGHRSDDAFKISRVVTRNSPLFKPEIIREKENQTDILEEADLKTKSLISLWEEGNDPTLKSIINKILDSGLFNVPELLKQAFEWSESSEEIEAEAVDFKNVFAFVSAIESPFSQFENYHIYINDDAIFGTHQGVKGLEFPRVMVIMDDEESRGFLFSYEKLFGAKEPTRTDIRNESEGKETSIERTRRLFYVTCSRAKESLAVVAYTNAPEALKEHILNEEWFSEEEIIELSADN